MKFAKILLFSFLTSFTSFNTFAKYSSPSVSVKENLQISSQKQEVYIICDNRFECIENLDVSIVSQLDQQIQAQIQYTSLGEIALFLGASCAIGVVLGGATRSLEYIGDNPEKKFEINLWKDAIIAYLAAGFGTIGKVPMGTGLLIIGLPAIACSEGSEVLVDKVHTLLYPILEK